MTTDSNTTDTADTIWREWRDLLVPALLTGLATLLYALLGFRGFGPPTADALATGREIAKNVPSLAPDILATPHPLFDLLVSPVGALLSAVPAMIPTLSVTLVAASLPAVWGIGRKLGGTSTAICATAIFALLPETVGAATALLPATVFIVLWCWFLRLLVVERHRWWSTLLLWLLGGALTLMWPMFLAWGAVWLYVELRDAAASPDDPSAPALPGEVPHSTMPIAILLAPLGVLVAATLLHPGFWSGPVDGWRQFLKHAVTWTGPTFSYGSAVSEHSRPPLWTGVQLGWWMLPALAAAGTLAGWLSIFGRPTSDHRTGRLSAAMCLWGLPFALLLPWIHRGVTYGELSFLHVLLPIAALTTGLALSLGYDACRKFAPAALGDTAARIAAGLVIAAVFVATGLLTTASHPNEGSYYNKLPGGFTSAVDTGLPVTRDDVYPLQALQLAQRKIGRAALHTAGEDDLVDAYRRTGLLPGIRSTDDPTAADARLRRLTSFSPADDLSNNPGTLLEVGPETTPLLRIDGVPIYWLER